MPVVIEQKEPIGSRLPRRQSAIPRPMKQLVLKGNGVSHSSKPSTDNIPMTPAKVIDGPTKNQSSTLLSRAKNLEMDPEIPVLELVPFGRQPIVDFGRVIFEHTQIRYVCMRNISDLTQQLFVRSFPKPEKGFNIDATEFLIAPKNELFITLSWTPKAIGSFRETITLQDDHKLPRRILVFGTAVRSKPELTQVKGGVSRRLNLTKISPKKINLHERQNRIQNRFATSSKKPSIHPLQRPLTRLKCTPKRNGLNPRRQSAQVVTKLLSRYDKLIATKVQSYFRMILLKRELNDKKQALLKIQAYMRMILVKKLVKELKKERDTFVTTKIQSYFRMIHAQHHLRELIGERQALVKTQSYMRMILAQKLARELKEERDTLFTTRLQSYFRMIQAQKQLKELKDERQALVKTQSYMRMILAKQHFENLKKTRNVIIKIQTYSRMIHAQQQFEILKKTRNIIIKIQTYARMIHAQQQFEILKKTRNIIIKIQTYSRMILAKQQFENLIRTRNLIIKIQSYSRMILAKHQCDYLRARWGIDVVERRAALLVAEQLQHKVMAEGRAESLCKHQGGRERNREEGKKSDNIIIIAG